MGDVIDARAALELAVISLAAGAGREADWAPMEASLAGLAEAIAAGDLEAALQQHLEFHLGILRAAHLPALELMLRPLHQVVMLSSSPPTAENPSQWELEAHREVLAQLRRRDPEAARAALARHYRELEQGPYREFRAARFREAPSVRAIVDRRLRGPA